MNVKSNIAGRLSLTIIIMSVVAAAAFGIVVGTVIPDPSGVIHGCYRTDTGSLRVVEAHGKCELGEQALSWNQSGQPGVDRTPQISIGLHPNGVPFKGSGFTVTKLSTGQYRLDFPPGSFSAFPIPNVTPLSGSNAIATVSGLLGFADGSGQVFIWVRDQNGVFLDSSLLINITM